MAEHTAIDAHVHTYPAREQAAAAKTNAPADSIRMTEPRAPRGPLSDVRPRSGIGLPLAINRLVAWAFVTHEVMLRNDNTLRALLDSAAHVRGNWWRCLGIIAFIGIMVAIPGPAISLTFLVFTEPPVTQSVHLVNMALYAGLLLPLAAISITLLFGDLIWRREAEAQARREESRPRSEEEEPQTAD
jgi:hypothetical protein